ncbi:unnamed protein product [Meganyctiphanes norvegica]|uniref:XK-related protein n=1 Tax=Meganyctiphanes norvegica TaxID=48144 RepID=A0AAV2PK43_MEGNR
MDALREGVTLALYSSKLGLDLVSCTNFCSTGDDPWWCGLTVAFTVLPSVAINAYLLYILHDKPSFFEVYKKVLLCIAACLQFLPFIWLAWSFVQLCRSNSKEINEIKKTTLAIMIIQGVLECVPQLSIQSYVVMEQFQNTFNATDNADPPPDGSLLDDWRYIIILVNLVVGLILVTFAISSGASYTAGEEGEEEEDEGTIELVMRIVLYLFPFIGIGTRVFICGVLATYNPGFWFIPSCSALLLSAVWNYIFKKDKTWDERLLDSIFNSTGNFLTKSSVPASFAYFLPATVFFALNVENPLCIAAFSLGLICLLINITVAALGHFLK